MDRKSIGFLRRIFEAYYRERGERIPEISFLERREFGFGFWERGKEAGVFGRHKGFDVLANLKKYLIDVTPRHVYFSGALYKNPKERRQENMGFQGSSLIFDVDVDHFFTPCKEKHDLWECKECGAKGKGFRELCFKCGSRKLKKLSWICSECLERGKQEVLKLIEILTEDFGIPQDSFFVNYSGHRGYHLRVEDNRFFSLESNQRQEIIDYLKGSGVSSEILGLHKDGQDIFGLDQRNKDYSQKLLFALKRLLSESVTNHEVVGTLNRIGLSHHFIEDFVNNRVQIKRKVFESASPLWNISSFTFDDWKTLLEGLAIEVGVKIDSPVTKDVSHLIRYPGSLHGKTGFRVQPLTISELKEFNPLNEGRSALDPIVFEGGKQSFKRVIIKEDRVPEIEVKGLNFGPYKWGQDIKIPNHIAVFLLCKEVASNPRIC